MRCYIAYFHSTLLIKVVLTSNGTGTGTHGIQKQVELQDGASADIVQENVQHLKELFPDAFTENGVNFDTLRQLLGDLLRK